MLWGRPSYTSCHPALIYLSPRLHPWSSIAGVVVYLSMVIHRRQYDYFVHTAADHHLSC
jgi:hypothetical protein